jgi:hypothetical protein
MIESGRIGLIRAEAVCTINWWHPQHLTFLSNPRLASLFFERIFFESKITADASQ